MNTEKLNIIDKLEFEDKIVLNGKVLYRGPGPKDLDNEYNYWEFDFYTSHNKKKSLFPKISHLVKIYTSFIEEKGVFYEDKYLKAVLKDLKTGKEEEFSVSK
jgi:hypothetical protein